MIAKTKKSEIYVLREPEGNHAIRYVGWAGDAKRRLRFHLNDYGNREKHTHKGRWIASLKARGLLPFFEVIEHTDEPNARERYWIARFRQEGCYLTNATDGGEGTQGRKATPEQIAILLGNRNAAGAVRSEETRAKMSAARRSRSVKPFSEAHKLAIAAKLTGRICSQLTRAKIGAANSGKQRSQALKDQWSRTKAGKPGHPSSAATNAKISAAKRGKPGHPCSRESIEKMRVTILWKSLPSNRVAQLWLLAYVLSPTF